MDEMACHVKKRTVKKGMRAAMDNVPFGKKT